LKIISRYIVREHAGPFAFALTALTSLMLLNFISRQFGELVGKGLPWKVIGQFFLLSIPFTIALTVPMSVLVAVLYAFSRLASENEVMALKANGVSPWRLVAPAIVGGMVMSIGLLAFNDQVLPRANHELKTLQEDIAQTKPALLLKEQIINPIAEGKFYLTASKVDQAGGRLQSVVIYDLADPARRRTIYADSGHIKFASNLKDLDLNLFHGHVLEVSTDKPSQLNRLFFDQDRIRMRDVGTGGGIHLSASNEATKGDREMSVCEMQKRLWQAQNQYEMELREYQEAKSQPKAPALAASARPKTSEPRGLGWAYCTMLRAMSGVREAHAADVNPATLHRVLATDLGTQDTTPKKKPDTMAAKPVLDTSTQKKPDTSKAAPAPDTSARKSPSPSTQVPSALQTPQVPAMPAAVGGTAAVAPPTSQQVAAGTAGLTQEQIAARAAYELMHPPVAPPAATPAAGPQPSSANSRAVEEKFLLERSQHQRDRYEIEINKKFSLAAACLIFCIVAPPIALRFPRGGIGLVIGVSLVVFAMYYVGLIGGEAAANNGLVDPFWAMWGTNAIMTLVGMVLMLRMRRDSGSRGGGGLRDWLEQRRFLRDERRAAAKRVSA
jgi:lipopolysaccharide export system permease protein